MQKYPESAHSKRHCVFDVLEKTLLANTARRVFVWLGRDKGKDDAVAPAPRSQCISVLLT
jgi:hypothetical protein